MVISNGANLSIIFGSIAFFGSMGVMGIIILRKRFLTKTIKVGFISDGGNIERVRYKNSEIKETIKKGKGRYIYDQKAVVTTWRGKEIYYYIGDINPIFFNRNFGFDGQEKTSVNKVRTNINPENLKAIIETELIAKLFKKEIFNTENVLLIICVALGVLSVGLLWSITQGVSIKDNPENIKLLKSIFVEAIKGV